MVSLEMANDAHESDARTPSYETDLARALRGDSPLRPRPPGRALLLALLTSVVVLASLIVAAFATSGGLTSSILATAAVLVLCARPALDVCSRWAMGPSGPAVAWLTLAGFAPLWFLLGLGATSSPLIASHFRCGTGHAGLVVCAPFVGFLLAGLAVQVANLTVGTARAATLTVLKGLVLALIALGAVVVVEGFVLTARRPSAEDYLASRPVIARLAPLEEGARAQQVELGGGVTARRTQSVYGGGCVLVLRRAGTGQGSGEYGGGDFAYSNCGEAISLRRDAEHGFLLVESERFRVRGDAYSGFDVPQRAFRGAFRLETLAPVDVRGRDLARDVRPPLGWLLGALVGVVLAVVTVLRARDRSGDPSAWREGVLNAEGWISFADGSPPVRAPDGDATLSAGPVVILPGASTARAPYRGDGTAAPPHRVVSGTREGLRVASRAARLGRWSYAFAAVTLPLAPLLAWVLVGYTG